MSDVADAWTKEQRLGAPNGYNSNDYDPATNPTGLDADGHVINMPRMCGDLATLGRELLAATAMAMAAAAQSDAWRRLEGGAVAKVSSTQISVTGDQRTFLTAYRAVRLSEAAPESGWITAVAYDVGLDVTTITVEGFAVPDGIAELWFGQDPGNAPHLAGIGGLVGVVLSITRDKTAGKIVASPSKTIATLADGLPEGLELDGSVVDLSVYPRLMRTWCGAVDNPTAPAWYRCTAGGVRDAAGGYIKLDDWRGEFLRGWDHGRGIDPGRELNSDQAADNAAHVHPVDPPSTTSGSSGQHQHTIAAQTVASGPGSAHSHILQNQAQVPGGSGSTIVWAISGGANSNQASTWNESGHTHSVTVPLHYSDDIGAHTHAVDIAQFNSGSQGTEARPRNKAVLWMVLV